MEVLSARQGGGSSGDTGNGCCGALRHALTAVLKGACRVTCRWCRGNGRHNSVCNVEPLLGFEFGRKTAVYRCWMREQEGGWRRKREEEEWCHAQRRWKSLLGQTGRSRVGRSSRNANDLALSTCVRKGSLAVRSRMGTG